MVNQLVAGIKNTSQARKARVLNGKTETVHKTTQPGLFVRSYLTQNVWWVRKMVGGRLINEQWDIDKLTFKEATAALHKMMDDLQNGIDLKTQQMKKAKAVQTLSKTFLKYAEGWVSDKADRVGESQKRSDQVMLKKCKPFWERHPAQIKRAEFSEFFIDHQKETGSKPIGIRRSLSDFYTYLVEAGFVEYHPVPKIGSYKPRTRVLRLKDLKTLFHYHFQSDYRADYRFQQIYQLIMLTGGLRISAIQNGHLDEITTMEADGKTYDVWMIPAQRMKRHTDNPFPHAIPLTPELRTLIDEIRDGRNTGYLFPAAISLKNKIFDEDKPLGPPQGKTQKKWREDLLISGDFFEGRDRQNSVDPKDLQFAKDIRTTMYSQILREKCKCTPDQGDLIQGRISTRMEGARGHYDFAQMIPEKFEILTKMTKALKKVVD
jgi:hypothetical protein